MWFHGLPARRARTRRSSTGPSLASAPSSAAERRRRRPSTFEAAEAWGGHNPFGAPFFILTHRPEDAPPPDAGFTFVNGLDEAIAGPREAAGDKDVFVMGGADVFCQALRAGHVEEPSISIAPVMLGSGKRLFDGFDETVSLEHLRLL